MSTTTTSTLDWWLDHLDASPKGDGYMALCPAHDDHNPSLSLTQTATGVRVHCFAGCTYQDILDAVESEKLPSFASLTVRKVKNNQNKPAAAPVVIPGTLTKASAWWAQYTGVSIGEWESWGARFTQDEIIFGWKDLITEKHRTAGTKKFFWTPEGCASPPLWPQIPVALPERVFLAEGESDAGVLRHLGLEAYALMKGVKGVTKTSPMWFALYQRGCREIVFVLDHDEASQKQVDTYVEAARTVGMRAYVLRLSGIVDPLLGEKDPRDVWIRLHDLSLRQTLEANIIAVSGTVKRRMDIMSFMRSDIQEAEWLVKDIILAQTVGLIVGMPKLGKTWLAHDLMISVASGKPFLNHFPVTTKGAVVYISKEDPDPLLHDRFSKVLASKGYGGSVSPNGRSIMLPPVANLPVFLELDRDFMFTDEGEITSLMEWLHVIKAQCNGISLIIFDPILKMISADVDIYNATAVNIAIFQPAERMRKETGAAILLVHHRSKGGSEGKASYGSIAFHAFSEGTQYLIGDEPDKDGWVHVRGEFKSAGETGWSYRLNDLTKDYTPEVVMGSKAPTKRHAVRDLIMLELKDGAMGIKELSEKIDVSEQTVREVLRVLQQAGEVERDQELVSKKVGGRPREFWTVRVNMPGGPARSNE